MLHRPDHESLRAEFRIRNVIVGPEAELDLRFIRWNAERDQDLKQKPELVPSFGGVRCTAKKREKNSELSSNSERSSPFSSELLFLPRKQLTYHQKCFEAILQNRTRLSRSGLILWEYFGFLKLFRDL